MNKKITVGVAVASIFIAIAITFAAAYIYSMRVFDKKISNVQERAGMYDVISQIDSYVRVNYKGSVDDSEVLEGMAEGYLASLGDENAKFLSVAEKAEIDSINSGSSEGVGVFTAKNASGYPVVTEVAVGSAADKSGLRVGDIIISIDNEDTLVMGYNAAKDLLFSDAGTSLKITFTRNGFENKCDTVCDAFKRQTIYRYSVNGYTLLKFASLSDNTTEELKDILSNLDQTTVNATEADSEEEKSAETAVVHTDYVFIDLRDSDCGYNNEAMLNVIRMLMPSGKLLSGVYHDDAVRMICVNEDSGEFSLQKFIVLVNEKTNGLAETMAAILSVSDNVTVVGTQTHGNGKWAELHTLSNGSAVYLSVCELIAGSDLQYANVGLTPDYIILPAEGYVLQSGEPDVASDVQLIKALELAQG